MPESAQRFAQQVLPRLVRNHPSHFFHFIFDRPFDEALPFSANVKGHLLSPLLRHPLMRRYWFDVRLPALLRTLKADVLLSPEDQCSLTASVPQCLVPESLCFSPNRKRQPFHQRHFTAKSIRKAEKVLVPSLLAKEETVARHGVAAEKVDVVYRGLDPHFQPLTFTEQDLVREAYTNGATYFFCADRPLPREALMDLLKAFSVFKRRLHSGMKLVLPDGSLRTDAKFTSLLSTYKYKDDVVLTGPLAETELAKLMASAYAFVCLSPTEETNVSMAAAMRCGIPVLAPETAFTKEMTGEAALFFNSSGVEQMADVLMRIYKDENGRAALIRKGLAAAEKFDWEKTAAGVWQALLQATNS